MKDNKKRYVNKSKQPRKEGEIKAVTVNDKFSHIEPVQAIPLEVVVYGNNFDKALRYFRSKVQKERILSLYKEKQSYEKPSNKRRRKRNEMKRKLMELDYNSKKQPDKKKTNAVSE
jgi:small subunit ribosomal protein S21